MSNHKRTLILDRDGILNKFEPGKYVTSVLNFHFCEGVLESVIDLAKSFDYIIIITNQAGVGKGLMSVGALRNIHSYMLGIIRANGGRIDGLYACVSENSPDRKPLLGMAVMAKKDFPDIEFEHTFVLGDSLSDMDFARNLGAIPVGIGSQIFPEWVELRFGSLRDFTNWYLITGVTSCAS